MIRTPATGPVDPMLRWGDEGPVTEQPEQFDPNVILIEYLRDMAKMVADRYSHFKPGPILMALGSGPIDAAVEVQYKGPRGRPPGARSDRRFWSNPNLVAAAVAQECKNDRLGNGPKRPGRRKMNGADGSLTDVAVKYGMDFVNEHYVPLLPEPLSRRANFETVKELLRKGRSTWPDIGI
jgi:hypothetical protein